jgi:hypothetical protein
MHAQASASKAAAAVVEPAKKKKRPGVVPREVAISGIIGFVLLFIGYVGE